MNSNKCFDLLIELNRSYLQNRLVFRVIIHMICCQVARSRFVCCVRDQTNQEGHLLQSTRCSDQTSLATSLHHFISDLERRMEGGMTLFLLKYATRR